MKADKVISLRRKTGLPVMQCKEALLACGGDELAAIEWLQKRNREQITIRDRETNEGCIRVAISPDGKTGSMVQLYCETAPVAHNSLFVDLADQIAKIVLETDRDDLSVDEIMPLVQDSFTNVYGQLRETIRLGTCYKVAGDSVASYVHHDGKSAAIIAMTGKPSDDVLGKHLAMHVTSIQPVAANCDEVPVEALNKVRALATEQAKKDGKPESIINKIVEGKIRAYYASNVLMEQDHIRSDVYGKKTVKQVLAENGVEAVTKMIWLTLN